MHFCIVLFVVKKKKHFKEVYLDFCESECNSTTSYCNKHTERYEARLWVTVGVTSPVL